MIAPFAGRVIEKHITLVGEVLKDDAGAFVIADLSSVWADLSVYEKNLPFVTEGAFTLRAQLGKGDLGHGHNH